MEETHCFYGGWPLSKKKKEERIAVWVLQAVMLMEEKHSILAEAPPRTLLCSEEDKVRGAGCTLPYMAQYCTVMVLCMYICAIYQMYMVRITI